MAGDDVTITIRADSGDAVRAFRDVNGQLRDMRGRFASESSIMSRSMNEFSRSIGNIKGYLIPLATAATPLLGAMTAATVKTAGAAAGAGVAVGAFGAALAGQVSSLSEASDAQKKYSDAVAKSGRGSKEAAEAQRAVQTALAGMPNATARASVALTTLKDTFRAWSDDLAGFTMAPVEKSFTILGQLLPKLTPMVQGTSTQLDRLLSVAGGAMATPGFDALTEKFADFANRSLREGVDGIIHFTRALSEGQASGPIQTFMEFAEANGPVLKETLTNVGNAVMTLVEASAEAGPGMLTLVNAGLQLVAALPPELVATVMQLAVGLKLVTLAGAGAAVAADGVRALGARITALGAASAAAGGGIAGLKAAFLSLGVAAKASIVVAGIAAVAVAFGKLGELGREAPPNVEKLATSLGQLGRTGKVSGEAARVFGKDLDGLYDKVRNITDPSTVDNIQNGLVKVFSLGMADSTPSQEARKALDGIDDSLTNLVKGGKADVAAAAFKRLKAEYVAGGGSVKDFTNQMDGYKAALADAKFEQQLAADSMGIFGSAAQDTSAKLDAQKSAADGLRASILALNDVNRDAHDAQTQFEASLDDLTESFKEHGNTLNADTEAGRANRDAMSAAAKAQDELLASGIAAGDSLGSMTKKSEELRETMMRLATDAFDGNKAKAKEYVDQLLGTPSDIKTLVKLEREEAITGLEAVRTAIQATPDAKEIKVETLNAAAIAALEAVGLKTKQLPDGRTAVYTANGQSLGSIGAVSTALNRLNGRTAKTFTTHTIRTINEIITKSKTYRSVHDIVGATGGLFTGRAFKRGYADGGLVEGPGTGTSDDVFAPWLSNGEFVIRAAAVKKYGEKFLNMLNEGAVDMPKMARGGKVSKAQARAKALRESERQARDDARGDLTISYFGQRAGSKNSEFVNALGSPDSMRELVSALNKWRSIIKKATHGGVEENLLKKLNSAGRALMRYEKQHDSISKTLEKAKALRDSVKSGVLSATNITRGASGDKPLTVSGLMQSMTEGRDKAVAFSRALRDLRKRGVSKTLIKQIADAGIEGGGLETAGALLRASGSEIRSLNSLQSQISKSATSAGNAAADAMYGAGLKAGDGLIAGLEKKQAAIEKQMLRIAKSMEKAIKRALGIKSPSKVMEEVGDYTAEGFAVGMRKNRSVEPAWTSMLNVPAVGGPRPAASGMGGQPIIVHQTITLDGRVVAQQIFEPLRREVRNRGGVDNAFKTTR